MYVPTKFQLGIVTDATQPWFSPRRPHMQTQAPEFVLEVPAPGGGEAMNEQIGQVEVMVRGASGYSQQGRLARKRVSMMLVHADIGRTFVVSTCVGVIITTTCSVVTKTL